MYFNQTNSFHYVDHRYVKQAGGIASERNYPYIGEPYDNYFKDCYFDEETMVEAKVKRYKMIEVTKTALPEEAIAEALVKHGPISAALDATGFQHYKGGVFYNSDCNSIYLTHGITIVGFTKNYWIIKNSWGTEWGDEGYIYLAKDRSNHCGIATYPAYVVTEKPSQNLPQFGKPRSILT